VKLLACRSSSLAVSHVSPLAFIVLLICYLSLHVCESCFTVYFTLLFVLQPFLQSLELRAGHVPPLPHRPRLLYIPLPVSLVLALSTDPHTLRPGFESESDMTHMIPFLSYHLSFASLTPS
jgi:hypothetical protein